MAIISGDRWVKLRTVFNMRDLGGLPTADGRRVRPGRLFRADNLGRLEAADKETFMALGIRTVIDLRRLSEVETMGKVPEWTGVTWLHHHLDHELWDHRTYSDAIGVTRWLADRYADLLTSGAADIARVVMLLSEVDSGPTVVHCVAGKDRTGLVAALTLSLLGVPDDHIAEDYAMTELSEEAYMDWLRRTNPTAAAKTPPPFYVQTPAETMRLTLAELRERHGSVFQYLARHGVSRVHVERMRAALVESFA
ncbi:MAG TPA: tyrosine-protein phosphatase [Candidatus Limnocylindrales bacterium]|nr:tyrosine-protein phosphatase [Candidatus Limnocylindrales bacterium]